MLSQVVGIDLTLVQDLDTAHINISINDETANPLGSEPSSFAWHRDSDIFPFVCVTMHSDCTGMIGGEAAILMPSGEIMKIQGPAMVRS